MLEYNKRRYILTATVELDVKGYISVHRFEYGRCVGNALELKIQQ